MITKEFQTKRFIDYSNDRFFIQVQRSGKNGVKQHDLIDLIEKTGGVGLPSVQPSVVVGQGV